MYVVLVIWLVAQIITLVYYRNTPQFSDAKDYEALAAHCYAVGTFYPDSSQVYSRFIFNPGYVNYLVLHLMVFGSLSLVGFFNILLNLLIAFEIFYLCKSLFNKNVAYIAVILYCLLPSNVLLVQPHLTEILFLALTFGAICLVRKDRYGAIVLAGVLFALANWVRPVVVLFVLPLLLYMIFNRFNYRNYLAMFVPFLLCVLLIAGAAKQNSGHFIIQASTGGYNLLQGANDEMNGGYGNACFKEGKIGYIENEDALTYAERDAIWKERSVRWVLDHPMKYVGYIPVKMARMWWGDDYLDGFLSSDAPFYGTHPTTRDKLGRVLSGAMFSLTYYIIMACFCVALFSLRKKMTKNDWLLLLPLILGTLMQALIYGTQRYHYPYMPIVVLFAAWWIYSKLTKKDAYG